MGKCFLQKEILDPAALLLMAATGKTVIYNRKFGHWETIQCSEPEDNAEQKEEEPVSG